MGTAVYPQILPAHVDTIRPTPGLVRQTMGLDRSVDRGARGLPSRMKDRSCQSSVGRHRGDYVQPQLRSGDRGSETLCLVIFSES